MAAEHSQADRLRSIEQDLELGVAGANLVALPQPVVICAELSGEEYGDAVRHVAIRGERSQVGRMRVRPLTRVVYCRRPSK